MKALRLVRSHRNVVYAMGALILAALALAAVRLSVPQDITGLELLLFGWLFGWLGIALGRLLSPARAPGQHAANADAAARSDRIDAIVRSIAKLLQAQANAAEAFSERLNGASSRLAQHREGSAARDIVLALIEDNRQMRDKLTTLRNQLEESRLQALQLRNNLERSEEAGMRDAVTLVGNRRYFDTTFAEALERARRTGEDFCLALADIDRFKLVNDRFGHLVGDRLLQLFAEILVQNVRGQDRVARFGGEEFALMLPGVNLAAAAQAMERIRKALEAKQWTLGPTGEPVGTITASFGVANLQPNETGTDLIKRTDERLYEAKTKGRNCVVGDDAEPPAPSEPAHTKQVANA